MNFLNVTPSYIPNSSFPLLLSDSLQDPLETACIDAPVTLPASPPFIPRTSPLDSDADRAFATAFSKNIVDKYALLTQKHDIQIPLGSTGLKLLRNLVLRPSQIRYNFNDFKKNIFLKFIEKEIRSWAIDKGYNDLLDQFLQCDFLHKQDGEGFNYDIVIKELYTRICKKNPKKSPHDKANLVGSRASKLASNDGWMEKAATQICANHPIEQVIPKERLKAVRDTQFSGGDIDLRLTFADLPYEEFDVLFIEVLSYLGERTLPKLSPKDRDFITGVGKDANTQRVIWRWFTSFIRSTALADYYSDHSNRQKLISIGDKYDIVFVEKSLRRMTTSDRDGLLIPLEGMLTYKEGEEQPVIIPTCDVTCELNGVVFDHYTDAIHVSSFADLNDRYFIRTLMDQLKGRRFYDNHSEQMLIDYIPKEAFVDLICKRLNQYCNGYAKGKSGLLPAVVFRLFTVLSENDDLRNRIRPIWENLKDRLKIDTSGAILTQIFQILSADIDHLPAILVFLEITQLLHTNILTADGEIPAFRLIDAGYSIVKKCTPKAALSLYRTAARLPKGHLNTLYELIRSKVVPTATSAHTFDEFGISSEEVEVIAINMWHDAENALFKLIAYRLLLKKLLMTKNSATIKFLLQNLPYVLHILRDSNERFEVINSCCEIIGISPESFLQIPINQDSSLEEIYLNLIKTLESLGKLDLLIIALEFYDNQQTTPEKHHLGVQLTHVLMETSPELALSIFAKLQWPKRRSPIDQLALFDSLYNRLSENTNALAPLQQSFVELFKKYEDRVNLTDKKFGFLFSILEKLNTENSYNPNFVNLFYTVEQSCIIPAEQQETMQAWGHAIIKQGSSKTVRKLQGILGTRSKDIQLSSLKRQIELDEIDTVVKEVLWTIAPNVDKYKSAEVYSLVEFLFAKLLCNPLINSHLHMATDLISHAVADNLFENGHEGKLRLIKIILDLLDQFDESAEISADVLNLLFAELIQFKSLPPEIFNSFTRLLQNALSQDRINRDSLIPYYLEKSFSFIIAQFRANSDSSKCFQFLGLIHLKALKVTFTEETVNSALVLAESVLPDGIAEVHRTLTQLKLYAGFPVCCAEKQIQCYTKIVHIFFQNQNFQDASFWLKNIFKLVQTSEHPIYEILTTFCDHQQFAHVKPFIPLLANVPEIDKQPRANLTRRYAQYLVTESASTAATFYLNNAGLLMGLENIQTEIQSLIDQLPASKIETVFELLTRYQMPVSLTWMKTYEEMTSLVKLGRRQKLWESWREQQIDLPAALQIASRTAGLAIIRSVASSQDPLLVSLLLDYKSVCNISVLVNCGREIRFILGLCTMQKISRLEEESEIITQLEEILSFLKDHPIDKKHYDDLAFPLQFSSSNFYLFFLKTCIIQYTRTGSLLNCQKAIKLLTSYLNQHTVSPEDVVPIQEAIMTIASSPVTIPANMDISKEFKALIFNLFSKHIHYLDLNKLLPVICKHYFVFTWLLLPKYIGNYFDLNGKPQAHSVTPFTLTETIAAIILERDLSATSDIPPSFIFDKVLTPEMDKFLPKELCKIIHQEVTHILSQEREDIAAEAICCFIKYSPYLHNESGLIPANILRLLWRNVVLALSQPIDRSVLLVLIAQILIQLDQPPLNVIEASAPYMNPILSNFLGDHQLASNSSSSSKALAKQQLFEWMDSKNQNIYFFLQELIKSRHW
jgi:hypothetical protein